MNFGLTPLCLKLPCDNDSPLPTHTPALRAGAMASKPNTRMAGESHSRLESSLYQYMKYIWGTLAMLRAHSLAELMLVEHRCKHQWRSSLEHWYSTSSSSPGWQNPRGSWEWDWWNSPEPLIFSLRLSESQCRKHAKSILTLNHNKMFSKRLDLQKASCKQRQSLVISVTVSWWIYWDQQMKLYVQVQFPPQSPVLQSCCTSGIKLLPLQTQ